MDTCQKDGSFPLENCKAVLKNKELWQKFHDLDTEMIITKSGRRMFPSMHLQISDLDPNAHYCIFLELVPAAPCRFKYSASSGWTAGGSEEAQSSHRLYMHPESPATGDYWMSQSVSFGRMKLTNTPSPPVGHIVLSSMHKYQPRVLIIKGTNPRAINWSPSKMIVFPETKFIAVTAYQNEQITKLKIDNNPFAKGFRENGQSKCKRKLQDNSSSPSNKKVRTTSPPLSPELQKSDDDRSSLSASPEVPKSYSPNPWYYPPYYPYLDYYPSYYCFQTPPPFFPVSRSQASWYYPHTDPHFSVPLPPVIEKPKKLTDFSIKAITGIS